MCAHKDEVPYMISRSMQKMNEREWYLGYQRPYQLRYFHHGVRFPKPGSV